jgi:L-lactate dehydrogenase complex protein LldF
MGYTLHGIQIMPDPFRQKILAALTNPSLQSALDGNAERRLKACQQAFAAFPEDLQSLRQRAHTVRSKTIAELDRYLDQFVDTAQSNGIIIHRAADAGEALQFVFQIAGQSGARLIAKSKSMVSEEIQFNHELETKGFQVVETDLGEYIVQLRGEPPAHIIAPAVHLSRNDVGRTFAEKLGIPFTDDIPTLTDAARRLLRQTFLNADIGVSGVNFGVAETGMLCLLTNEGNGRMVTTLPDIHIALMGIERIAPTLEDLTLMLTLLPRSATGQKITVYASLIQGPRQPGEIDGPSQRHLILVDNGRQALRGTLFEEALLCIRCGACLNACPVFREIGGHAYVSISGQPTPYPGPIGSVISPGLFGLAEFGNLARATSLCGVCKEACPVDIDLPGMLLRLRAAGPKPVKSSTSRRSSQKSSHIPYGLRLGLGIFSWVTGSPRLYSTAQRLSGAFSRLLSPRSPWLRLSDLTGWGISRDFPRPALRPFRSRFSSTPHISSAPAPLSAGAPAPLPLRSISPSLPLIERFESELTALGGIFTRCSCNEVGDRILKFLQSRQIVNIQTWENKHLPPGVLDKLQTSGIQVNLAPDPDIQAGLTGALAGIAETGTLVLPGGSGRPLTASLLPEIHLAIVYARDLSPDLKEFFNKWKSSQDLDSHLVSSITLVSGPSRTADIEMTLTIGVHGPREVQVFCIE